MLTVDDYGRIRRAHRDGMSIRAIARTFHHSRRKVREVLARQVPQVRDLADLNAYLRRCCLKDRERPTGQGGETVGDALSAIGPRPYRFPTGRSIPAPTSSQEWTSTRPSASTTTVTVSLGPMLSGP